MTDQDIEQEIQAKGLTAPRITPDDIEANVACEFYFTASEGVDGADIARLREQNPDAPMTLEALGAESKRLRSDGVMSQLRLLTFCVLVLRNGFTVTGESACASPTNFNAEIGRKIARQNAVAKVWPLMGYELRSKLAYS